MSSCKRIEFFFDFISPFAYLAWQGLPPLAAEFGYDIVFRPIDLIAVKLAAGNDGPATRQIAPKFRYIRKDLARWAGRYGIPLAFGPAGEMPPGASDSSLANKGAYYARALDQEAAYLSAVWRQTLGSGGFVGAEATLRNAVAELGWAEQPFQDFVRSDEAETMYRAGVDDAIARGVFGVPTMLIGDEMWWGNDRLHFLREHLAELQSA